LSLLRRSMPWLRHAMIHINIVSADTGRHQIPFLEDPEGELAPMAAGSASVEFILVAHYFPCAARSLRSSAQLRWNDARNAAFISLRLSSPPANAMRRDPAWTAMMTSIVPGAADEMVPCKVRTPSRSA